MSDFLFRETINELDPDLYELIQLEAERQYRKIILIPSESSTPQAIRDALASAFHNIYAEGYPPDYTRTLAEEDILDYAQRLNEFRRYSDPRYYKGVEYANIVEALARRRCAEVFATGETPADRLFVNVQPLSGGPANNAVYHALVKPGDTVMGMDLRHGGHLSHGSPVNRSGKFYNIVSYEVDPDTGRLNYDEILRLAEESQPKMIIAGVSSYPWTLDWLKFREIADRVGAYLMTDIAHIAGLVAGGVYPSPVGLADVVTFTTHKSLCGPRGAVILTHKKALSSKLDRAVFPGEQGGPHVNVFAAMALAFRLARTPQFMELQKNIVTNAAVLADTLNNGGLTLAFGGTDTHLLNIDLRTVKGTDGAHLSGDMAARILDNAGIVVNRNTIPGDTSARNPSGIRLGTPWITQRGFTAAMVEDLGKSMAKLLTSTQPYYQGRNLRAKIPFASLMEAKREIADLVSKAGIDFEPGEHGYPHYIDREEFQGERVTFEIGGQKVREFLNFSISADIEALGNGEAMETQLCVDGEWVSGLIAKTGDYQYSLTVDQAAAAKTANWLRSLSDGYIHFDDELVKKIPGPVTVTEASNSIDDKTISSDIVKPYYIGIQSSEGEAKKLFQWEEREQPLQRTPVYDLHLELGARMVPFAGWEMPVKYTSVMDEHLAVRNAAGIFDVAHMGVYQAEGTEAVVFLDSVCGNDISSLDVGESLYTHFMDPDANVIDDLLVYRRGVEQYLVVVNASNDDKDWAWLNAVKNGDVKVDNDRPGATAFGRNVKLRNLRDPQAGDDMRVDIALQGPRSREILLSLEVDDETRMRIMGLKRTQLTEATIDGMDLVVSRTGYTGERMAFELFVHPGQAARLFRRLLDVGETVGLKPCGLGARDSLRTEAGLPLYGHEMGGEMNLGVADAGFGSYVKTYKPWFIGRKAYVEKEEERSAVVVRFKFNTTGVRMAHPGDPVMDKRGKVIGKVTSCAADKEGYLVGQAYVDLKSSVVETPIFIFQSASAKTQKAPATLDTGDRVVLPTEATVIKRFP